MLTKTFCHLPGVGPKTEQKLWARGIHAWDSPDLRQDWADWLLESRERFDAGDAAYFADALPAREQWRLYGDFHDSCAFVDIETTGDSYQDIITTIALFDGETARHYVHGQNLEAFCDDIRDFKLLVTYNGKTFDAPVLRRCLRARLPVAHIDLRHTLRSLGLSGGLKSCERQIGIERGDVDGVDGYMAVLLWHEYRSSLDPRVLETLLAYNTLDAVNLQTLMIHAYNEKVSATPFHGEHSLPSRRPPEMTLHADRELVARLLGYAKPRVGGVPLTV
jgi:uncharacterized protein YprB with RNaseH-like and TPR domain